jgi:Stigma-specific protein, Stig1
MVRPALLAAVLVLTGGCTNAQPCPSPLEECDGQCVDVQSNRRHCGFCGVGCVAGQACIGGSCRAAAAGPCADRHGGSFVTLGFDDCFGTAKVWVHEPGFVAEAASYVGTTAPSRAPVFSLLDGTDCDAQWSWHVDPATPVFVTTVTASCDVCPQAIQASWTASGANPATWCPSDAKVLAVEQLH